MAEVEAPSPDDDGGSESELTPAQRRELNRRVGYFYRGFVPKLDIKFPKIDLAAASMVSKIAADVAKWRPIPLSDEVLKNFTGASIVAETHARLMDQWMPMLSAQKVWQKNFAAAISSDILKVGGAGIQSQLNLIALQLTKSANFGLSDQLALFAKQYADQQATWLKGISPFLATLGTNFFPSNLQGIEELGVDDIEKVVMLDGIALYEVPRAAIAERLVRAASSAGRREILGRKWREIAADCRAALGSCRSAEAASMVRFANNAVDALESGNAASAQSLAGSLIDTILRQYLPRARPLLLPSKKVKNADAYMNFAVRKYIALAPIWQAYQRYVPENCDRVPRTFNRHATAHTVGLRQYSRRNAVQGLMLVCGLLKFLDEQASVRAVA